MSLLEDPDWPFVAKKIQLDALAAGGTGQGVLVHGVEGAALVAVVHRSAGKHVGEVAPERREIC